MSWVHLGVLLHEDLWQQLQCSPSWSQTPAHYQLWVERCDGNMARSTDQLIDTPEVNSTRCFSSHCHFSCSSCITSTICVMSVLASPTSPTTMRTGSVKVSRQRRSTRLRKVALNRRAEEKERKGGSGRKGEGEEREGRERERRKKRGQRNGKEKKGGRTKGKEGEQGKSIHSLKKSFAVNFQLQAYSGGPVGHGWLWIALVVLWKMRTHSSRQTDSRQADKQLAGMFSCQNWQLLFNVFCHFWQLLASIV